LEHPRERILVVGHTEWGEPRKLAGARAQAVIDYFASKELSRERFDLEARPANEPPPANRTPREREHDRRVFFRLIEEGSSEP
jgi:outer membrane protein OmpA-like peptidoglycan-associated protein